MKDFFSSQDIFTKFDAEYFPKQRYKLQRNCADQVTIAYGCHTN